MSLSSTYNPIEQCISHSTTLVCFRSYQWGTIHCLPDSLETNSYEWMREQLELATSRNGFGLSSGRGVMEHLLELSTRVTSLGRITSIQRKIIAWFLDRMAIDIGMRTLACPPSSYPQSLYKKFNYVLTFLRFVALLHNYYFLQSQHPAAPLSDVGIPSLVEGESNGARGEALVRGERQVTGGGSLPVTHYVFTCHSLCIHLSLTMYLPVTHYQEAEGRQVCGTIISVNSFCISNVTPLHPHPNGSTTHSFFRRFSCFT